MATRVSSSVVASAVLLALVTACSGSGTSTTQAGPSGTPTGSGATPTPAATQTTAAKPPPPPGTDACTVLTLAVARQVLGPTAKAAAANSTPSTSKCHYTLGSTQSYVELGIRRTPATQADLDRVNGVVSKGAPAGTCSAQQGLGDSAYFCDAWHDSSTSVELYLGVLSGDTLIFFGVSYFDSELNTIEPKSRNQTFTLAHQILG